MIDAREPQILERLGAQRLEQLLARPVAVSSSPRAT